MKLSSLGWSQDFQHAFEGQKSAGLVPGRVIRAAAERVWVYTEAGELNVIVPKSLRRIEGEAPVTGDWVAVCPERGLVRSRLPRRTQFVRQAAGKRTQPQVLAANMDWVFIVMALTGDFNLRRLDRYLTLVRASGAQAAVLLTKAGLCADHAHFVELIQGAHPHLPAHAIDVVDGIHVEALNNYVGNNMTLALLGSSGAGKSTLANFLLGETVSRIGEVSTADGRGQHTTTRRELFPLPQGGAVIDTPGLRELQLWGGEEHVDLEFQDLGELAAQCRFRDCQHRNEPGCALRRAVRSGELTAERFASFMDLKLELRNHEQRRDVAERRAQSRAHSRLVRAAVRQKYGR